MATVGYHRLLRLTKIELSYLCSNACVVDPMSERRSCSNSANPWGTNESPEEKCI